MGWHIVDSVSVASGEANEDRAGARGDLAWVIDGATDVVDDPLTGGASDASWLAGTLHRALVEMMRADDLDDVLARLTAAAAAGFERAATRPPRGREEHPSAAGIIMRITGDRLEYVSLGDCGLIAGIPGAAIAHCHGTGTPSAGDVDLAARIARFQASVAEPTAETARRHVIPIVRSRRTAMNTERGYGVLSITPTPPRLVGRGMVQLAEGAHVLLLTDGLARLVDVYREHTPQTLLEAACRRGLAALVADLRAIEAADPDCLRHPRAKARDDATGLLLAPG